MPHMLMEHQENPAEPIYKKIGNLDDFPIFGNLVLIGVYERPEKTKSGILLAQTTRDEDKNQGKAGLVLKKGPGAFKSDKNYDFHGMDVVPGEWVAIFVSDGRPIVLNGQLCRLVEDQHIRLKIPTPDSVF